MRDIKGHSSEESVWHRDTIHEIQEGQKMRVSYKYLQEIVNFPFSPQELAEQLTRLGLEVKNVEDFGKLEKVVIGKIVSIENHPNADKIKVVRVDVGIETIPLVCGASNIKEGMLVPVALEGARLKGGIRVKKVRVRGIDSPGMICSENELGLGEDQSGVMLLASRLPLGTNLSHALDLEDTVLDLEITSNRGDCLSMIGVAREIAALTGESLHLPSFGAREDKEQEGHQNDIEIKDINLCPYYGAHLIRDVTIGPSPHWLRHKVLIAGAVPINNIVDITNYVLWEMGQPLHAFDYGFLEGRKIIVRRAKKSEFLVTLDGIRRELNEDMLVIADSTRPVALAGIMGGKDTQVTDSTLDVLLESAYFDSLSVQRTSKKMGLTTEASSRFGRRVDPSGVRRALERASLLIEEIAGGKFERVLAKGKLPIRKRCITLRPARVHHILGSRVVPFRMKEILENLQFRVEKNNGDWKVSVPSFRPDVSREIDLIEEIIRFHGYDRLKTSLPSLVNKKIGEDLEEQRKEGVREILKGLGFYEVISVPFAEGDIFRRTNLLSEEKIKIRNPLSSQQEFLVSHLFPRLLKVTSYNLTQSIEQLRIFEVSEVFQDIHPLKEIPSVGGLVYEDSFDFFSMKGIVETLLEGLDIKGVDFVSCDCAHLSSGQRASVLKGSVVLGGLGRLEQGVAKNLKLPSSIYLFEFDFSRLMAFSEGKKKFRHLPRFPALRRDLAIIVPENISAKDVKEGILKGGKWLERVDFFDLYRGQGMPSGYKSLAFSLVFRALNRTLTDKEVDRVQEKIVNLLKVDLGASIRERL